MKKHRKHYTPEENVAILRRHLLEKEPIFKLCDELDLQPTVFYRWQKEFFENGAPALEQKMLRGHLSAQFSGSAIPALPPRPRRQMQKDRAVRFPGYFFQPACQFSTTVTGGTAAASSPLANSTTKNR
jgi:transposase-like protein